MAKEEQPQQNSSSRDLEAQLDRLEKMIAELRVQYEQYFLDIVSSEPEDLRDEVKKYVRYLQNAPFKSSALKFRLANITRRLQTYTTYWSRVLKQGEEGTYHRDLFKAKLRTKIGSGEGFERSVNSAARSVIEAKDSIKELYDKYLNAIDRAGKGSKNVDYNEFRQSLLKKTKDVQSKNNTDRVSYQVVISNGKPGIKVVPQ